MTPSQRTLIALAGAMIWSATALAQAPPDSSATRAPAVPTLLQGGVMGELLTINVPRSESDIQGLIEEARLLEKMAGNEIATGLKLAGRAEDRTKIMKEELETTKLRWDAAKKEKDKAKTSQYAENHKRQSQEIKYLSQLTDAVRADADRLEAARSAAAATAVALERELAVVRKQTELATGTPAPAAIEQFRSQLRGMLESQRDAAVKAQISANKKKAVAELRLKQLAALAKL